MSNLCDFFDDIICINKKTTEKYTEDIFNRIGIPIRTYSIDDDDIQFKHHIKILKDAYENDLDNILIFEDDIVPTDSYNLENITILIDFMKNNEDWDILYLGYECISYQNKYNTINTIFNSSIINKNIIKCDLSSSFATCYNKRSFKKILDTYEDFIDIIEYDKYLAEYIDLNNYLYIPMLFTKKYIESTCDCCFMKPIIDFICNININYNISLINYNLYDENYNILFICLFSLSFLIIKYNLKILLNYNKKNTIDRCLNTLDINNSVIKILLTLI